MENNVEIENSFSNLIDFEKNTTSKESDIRKAVLNHRISEDYDFIEKYKEDYPVQDILYLVADFRTATKIDLNKLFKDKYVNPTISIPRRAF